MRKYRFNTSGTGRGVATRLGIFIYISCDACRDKAERRLTAAPCDGMMPSCDVVCRPARWIADQCEVLNLQRPLYCT